MNGLFAGTSFSKTPRASGNGTGFGEQWPTVASGSGFSPSLPARSSSRSQASWSAELEAERARKQTIMKESLAFLVVGMSGWWTLNAVLAQLPTFVVSSVEHDEIGNQLSTFTQLGNVFPFVYTAFFTEAVQQRYLVRLRLASSIHSAAHVLPPCVRPLLN